MQRDIRETDVYREADALSRALRRPGSGLISDAAEVVAFGDAAVFAGTLIDDLSGAAPTRVCSIDLATGDTRVLTFGPHVDRSPKFSPDGRQIAFLSDRAQSGEFALYLLDLASGAARATPSLEGWVEYLHWSPDGRRILLGVAGRGADVSGQQGAVSSQRDAQPVPSWMPTVESGNEQFRWRRAWVYELDTNCVRLISDIASNIWEAAWCGNTSIVAVVSPGPGEGLWYSARLHIVDIHTGIGTEIYVPRDQLACPSAAPSGKHIAVIEAVCSDRGVAAGDLLLIEAASGRITRVDTMGTQISCIDWRSDEVLLLAGCRGFETVIGLCNARASAFTQVWASRELSAGWPHATASGLNDSGDCILIAEGFSRAPELGVIRDGTYRTVRSFDTGYVTHLEALKSADAVSWQAPDGTRIDGWLLRPRGIGLWPLAVTIHGGPVWHWRPFWLGRSNVAVLMLLARGFAVFFPNPRGSSGRDQEFARCVVGDMGGADTYDLLSGIDYLIQQGIADAKRVCVTGVSYGGFMTAWLVTQDSRFAAAVAVAPMTNHVTEHLTSNIPHFVSLFLSDTYANPDGKYFQRSPVMHAHRARTPTLSICGALDKCTPPQEAVQFHNALRQSGVEAVLVTYPEEGHGIRKWPAAIDYAARLVSWFERHTAEAPHV